MRIAILVPNLIFLLLVSVATSAFCKYMNFAHSGLFSFLVGGLTCYFFPFFRFSRIEEEE